MRDIVLLAGLALCFSGCKTTHTTALMEPKMFSGSPVPDWIYEPEYYVYHNGRYKFFKGYYRRILFRKSFRKRSLLGYGSKI